MALGWIAGLSRTRVSFVPPGCVALAGLSWLAVGHTWVGAGIAVGAMLAYVNGLLLSRRVDLATTTGNLAGAMVVMQAGMIVTLIIIGLATILLIKLSLSMAIASAAGFGVSQIAILGAFYWLHGRVPTPTEAQTR
jgi:hypothetical protein